MTISSPPTQPPVNLKNHMNLKNYVNLENHVDIKIHVFASLNQRCVVKVDIKSKKTKE